MITINLLSPEQKNNLRLKKMYITFKELVMLFLLFTSIVAIILLASQQILEQQLTILITSNAEQIQAINKINKQIITINTRVEEISAIQQGFKKWSEFFRHLSELTPDNISYDSVKIHYQEAITEVSGQARTRQDLINLKDQFEKSKLFTKIELPINNLLARENNIFHLQANINLDYIP